ncbi:hypothetical protein KIW84_022998 [Lathyrus oleraceus]|uniref:Uncharacterized protein n=1 Tax=Pisum sativum TaxID=3888 RepID=A0A9D4YBV0_PEA|nr:hypothetical protein KIW84_022998 [Pisum sativum]
MLNTGSNMLDEILEIREKKAMGFNYSYMNNKFIFLTKKFVAPEKKNEFLMKNHMFQHPTQHRKDGQVAHVNYEVNDLVNNVSDIIDDVVIDSVSADDGYFHKNTRVHVGYAHVNEGITKDVDLSKRSDKKSKKMVENRKVILKAKMTSYKKIPTPTTKHTLEK